MVLFYVAWLNHDGPGEVCQVERHFTECAQQWNPWPWVMVGVVFLSVGIAMFYGLGRVRPAA